MTPLRAAAVTRSRCKAIVKRALAKASREIMVSIGQMDERQNRRAGGLGLKVKSKMRTAFIVALLALAVPCMGQTAPTSFEQDWNKLLSNFTQGGVSNFTIRTGASYQEKGVDKWGGFLLLGYNTPKLDFPMQPYLEPYLGLHYFGGSWYGVSGNCSVKTDLHLLRMFAGTATNSLLYKFTLTPYGRVGVGENLSGRQFGSFTVPGHPADAGQGTAAITGYGVQMHLGSIKQWDFALFAERSQWTTVVGPVDNLGIKLQFSPKGW